MHITPEQLSEMGDAQLDELHNFARCREKHHHRLGHYALAQSWRAIGSTVLLYAVTRATSDAARDAAQLQAHLF